MWLFSPEALPDGPYCCRRQTPCENYGSSCWRSWWRCRGRRLWLCTGRVSIAEGGRKQCKFSERNGELVNQSCYVVTTFPLHNKSFSQLQFYLSMEGYKEWREREHERMEGEVRKRAWKERWERQQWGTYKWLKKGTRNSIISPTIL